MEAPFLISPIAPNFLCETLLSLYPMAKLPLRNPSLSTPNGHGPRSLHSPEYEEEDEEEDIESETAESEEEQESDPELLQKMFDNQRKELPEE
ncbi:hypothetical protein AMTR_s00019p00050720 [Amborella trichopoda]|uniref:Uncharacterized protein n=1 Tax=Amborella trichopoda TaxID=13333 RepID=W1PH89_AMBTC|nr:hypothetical protein AMTR_s00019p00050720 [Amborella trichopoda]